MKKIIVSMLCIAILCTLFVGSASAASSYTSIDGNACRGYIEYNSTYTYAKGTSSFPDAYASYMYVKAYYSYTIDGNAYTETNYNEATNVIGSIYTTASRPSSNASPASATSRHTFTYNGTTKNLSTINIYP